MFTVVYSADYNQHKASSSSSLLVQMISIVTTSYTEQACAVTGIQSKQLQEIYIRYKYDKQVYHKL